MLTIYKASVSSCPKLGMINTEETEANEGKAFAQGHPWSSEVAEAGQGNVLTSKPVHLKQFQKFCRKYLALFPPQVHPTNAAPLLPETTFFNPFHYLLLYLLPYLQVISIS